jgi:DNA invertase Pin-like site-specific DNA recombinase
MNPDAHQKVHPRHLKRAAYLYVRQSTLRQVFENTESTRRQYDLRQRAVALGWAVEQIVVVDDDLGQSGATAVDREGFQRLVAEVGLGRAGIVMGLEVSRLARNSTDWHRLLEICALADTLILDEDGVYDPSHFNDRLLLGLKGTMSEAELHVLRARLRGGILNKARRGDLEVRLPIGFVYAPDMRVVLDPDVQVQDSVHALFKIYRETGTASATVKAFRDRGLRFPRRTATGDLTWQALEHSKVLWVLRHPRYAGAFCFGRTRQRKKPGGGVRFEKLPRTDWVALIPDAHPGYIGWAEFEENQQRLREHAPRVASDRARTPPREGPALLQGLVICGICGKRMTVRYDDRGERLVPSYYCGRLAVARGEPTCQQMPGGAIDARIGELLVEALTPEAVAVALAVQDEVQARVDDADRLRARQVERARYESDLARRRYMQVDPSNRLVADVLEADWNAKLRALSDAQTEYEARRAADRVALTLDQRDSVAALATDFPALWRDPRTTDRDRKRMVRLLVEDVTLLRGDDITVHVRFRGGTSRTLIVPRPLPAWAQRKTEPELVAEIDRLLDTHTNKEIVVILNERGLRSGEGKPLSRAILTRITTTYGLRSRYDRLRAAGMLTAEEAATLLGVRPSTVASWRIAGFLVAATYDDRGGHLYAAPGPVQPVKYKHKKFGPNAYKPEVLPQHADEVQCET